MVGKEKGLMKPEAKKRIMAICLVFLGLAVGCVRKIPPSISYYHPEFGYSFEEFVEETETGSIIQLDESVVLAGRCDIPKGKWLHITSSNNARITCPARDAAFYVRGTLTVEGITFDISQSEDGYGAIYTESPEGLQVKNCQFVGAPSEGPGILVRCAKADIENCSFSNLSSALMIWDGSTGKVRNCVFAENEQGLLVGSFSEVRVKGSLFYKNEVGVLLGRNSQTTLYKNTFGQNELAIRIEDRQSRVRQWRNRFILNREDVQR